MKSFNVWKTLASCLVCGHCVYLRLYDFYVWVKSLVWFVFTDGLSSTTCTLDLGSCLVYVHYVSWPLVRSLLISGFIQNRSTFSSFSIIRCSSYLHLLTFVVVNCNRQPTQKNYVSRTMLSLSEQSVNQALHWIRDLNSTSGLLGSS